MYPLPSFSARVIGGRGRGKTLTYPTINVSLHDVPPTLAHGVYACRVTIGSTVHDGALHYGPRATFHDTDSCEIHLIDATVAHPPATVDIRIIEHTRDVRAFADAEALKRQIAADLIDIRAILSAHVARPQESHL